MMWPTPFGAQCGSGSSFDRASSASSFTSRAIPVTHTLHPPCENGSMWSTSNATTESRVRGVELGPGPGADEDALAVEQEVDGQDHGQRTDAHRHATEGAAGQQLQAFVAVQDSRPFRSCSISPASALRHLAGRGEGPVRTDRSPLRRHGSSGRSWTRGRLLAPRSSTCSTDVARANPSRRWKRTFRSLRSKVTGPTS